MKLDATAKDELFLAVHFERRFFDSYEQPMLDAFNQLAPRLRRTVELHTRLSNQFGKSIAAAAITARMESVAFVVDERGHLIDANAAASVALASADVLKAVPSGVEFQDTDMQNWFLHTVQALITGRPVANSSRFLASATALWRLSLTRVPEIDPRERQSILPATLPVPGNSGGRQTSGCRRREYRRAQSAGASTVRNQARYPACAGVHPL